MPITLKCKYESGSVALHVDNINGFVVHERRYEIADYEVILDGYDEAVLKHDAQQLLMMPNGLYAMPTPKEQNVKAEAQRQAATVEETVPVVSLKKAIGG